MRVFAEFVGGPLDGAVAFLPGPIRRYRHLVDSSMLEGDEQPGDSVLYEFAARRRFDSPTGDPVFRFEVAGA